MRRLAPIFVVMLLASCGGGGGGSAPDFSGPNPAPVSSPTEKPTATAQPTATAPPGMVPTLFTISIPTSGQSSARNPQYVGAGVKSVTITLNTVDGGAPPNGLTTTVTSNITLPCAPCTVPGPSVPPGSDAFTINTFDALNAGGNEISTGSPTLVVTEGQTYSAVFTLDGVPASFSVTGLPSATAGTAFASPKSFALTVKDADGNTITGTYANSVTISDSDTSSLTLGSALAVNGGSATSSAQSTASTDTFTIAYGGLSVASATITASATGATNGTATFAPTLSPIVYSGPLNGSTPDIALYAASGTGSTGSFTASEVGWTNSPYNKSITASASGCSHIGTTSPASGTSFTTTIVASPVVGSCTLTLSDFTGGNTKAVTITYTAGSFGIQ